VFAGHLTEHTAERWLGAWRTALDRAARTHGTVRGSLIPSPR
jgi:hypothetical protein